MPIRGFIKGTDKFPIQKCAIFRKFKEIKELRGGILLYAAQAIPQTCHAQGVIDAEIAEKGHLWTETNYRTDGDVVFKRDSDVSCLSEVTAGEWKTTVDED